MAHTGRATLGWSSPADALRVRQRWAAAAVHPLVRRNVLQGSARAPIRLAPAAASARGHASGAAAAAEAGGKPRLLLVDGHNLAHRAFHVHQASARGPLTTSTGVPTSVCHTFLTTLLKVADAYRPQALAVAFDIKGGATFRRNVFATYKEGRRKMPPEFNVDVDNTVRVLQALGIQMPAAAEYEADDVIGTLATRAADKGYEVWIFTNDKDMYQLVRPDDSIRILRPTNASSASSPPLEVNAAGVVDKLGVQPEQVVDYLALVGDSADAYPGVRGIGEKTAGKLLREFGSVGGIMAALPQVAPRQRQLLQDGQADLGVSLQLARIRLDAPVQPPQCLDPDSLRLPGADMAELEALLRQLELGTHVRNLAQFGRVFGVGAPSGRAVTPLAAPAAEEPQSEAPSAGADEAPASPVAPAPAAAPDAAPAASADAVPTAAEADTEAAEDGAEGSAMAQLAAALGEWSRVAGAQWQQYAASFQPSHVLPPGPQPLVSPAQSPWAPALPPAWAISVQPGTKLRPGALAVECCVQPRPDASPRVVTVTLPLESSEAGARLQVVAEHRAEWEQLAGWLGDAAVPKTLHDGAAAAKLLRDRLGVELRGVAVDGVMAAYVLSSEAKADLDTLLAKGSADGLPEGVPQPPLPEHAGCPSARALQAAQGLVARLRQVPTLERLYFALEIPLMPVLRQMEATGVAVDPEMLKQISQEVREQLQAVEAAVAASIEGTPGARRINLSSAREVSWLLFEVLKLDTKQSRKITTGWSTDQNTLAKLKGAHPVVELLMEHRQLSTLRSSYLDILQPHIRPATGRIHTTYNQASASTGRLSSTEPNLQAIPVKGQLGSRVRAAFVPRPGWLLAAADYSQIELRLLAHLSGEPELVAAFRQGLDVHSATARAILCKTDITKEERRMGKTVNFAVIYGQGAKSLSDSLGLPMKTARQFIDAYQERYSRVFAFLEGAKRRAVALGYAESLFGRRRFIDFQAGELKALRKGPVEAVDLKALKISRADAAQMRAAANAPLQGSSSDIIKLAMLAIAQELARGGFQSRMLLQVHDELVLEVEPSEWPQLEGVVRRCMEGVAALSVPLEVNISTADNWLACK